MREIVLNTADISINHRRKPSLCALWRSQHQPLAARFHKRFIGSLIVRSTAIVINEVALSAIRSEILPAHVVMVPNTDRFIKAKNDSTVFVVTLKWFSSRRTYSLLE